MKRVITIALMLVLVLVFSGSVFAAINVKDLTAKSERAVVFVRSFDDKGREIALGSGFFIAADGTFVTNRHVLQGAASAEIETVDGKVYKLRKVGKTLPDMDVAVGEVEKTVAELPFLDLAEDVLTKGESIIVLGNPQGMKFSVSEGIVSGMQKFPNREYPNVPFRGNFIQFTAPISPGSSGGPIINEKGKVIGIATLSHKGGQNLNLAVPAEDIRRVLTANRTASEDDSTVTKGPQKVGFIVMYGPKLSEQIKDEAKRTQVTESLVAGAGSKFRPNKYILKSHQDTLNLFNAYYRVKNGLAQTVKIDDVDRDILVAFAEQQGIDYLVFAAIEIDEMQKDGNLSYASAAVSVEVDLRIVNTERKYYSYSKILYGEGSEVMQKFWGWENVNMAKPVIAAVTRALKQFKREFTSEQLL